MLVLDWTYTVCARELTIKVWTCQSRNCRNSMNPWLIPFYFISENSELFSLITTSSRGQYSLMQCSMIMLRTLPQVIFNDVNTIVSKVEIDCPWEVIAPSILIIPSPASQYNINVNNITVPLAAILICPCIRNYCKSTILISLT